MTDHAAPANNTYILQIANRSNLTFEYGRGVHLYTGDGTRYLDFAAGIAVCSLGHAHPHLVTALQDQAAKVWHVSNQHQTKGLEDLARRLCLASGFAQKAFFCNSGAEAIECGLKMTRKFQHHVGHPEKYRIITFENAFHGRTIATISAVKREKLTKGFEPLLDGFDVVPFNDLNAVKNAITPQTAGILLEGVQGEGGIRPATDDFLRGLRALCDEHGLLLFFDAVQCGMGRTGKLFSHEWSDIKPDILSTAKGLGGGFPVGACIATDRVACALTMGSHGSTYANNPLAVRVASAVLDIILADGFLDDVVAKGEYAIKKLRAIAAKYPKAILEVRGRGLMLGLKVGIESQTFVETLRAARLLTVPGSDNMVRLLPPLIITREELDEGFEIIEETARLLSTPTA